MIKKAIAYAHIFALKVLSYWNLNYNTDLLSISGTQLKVLSYWNLNLLQLQFDGAKLINLKYYHIGI